MMKKIFDLAEKTFSPDFLKNTACRLNNLEKSGCYSDFDASTKFVMQAMREAGFVNIERIAMKADGVTEAFDAVMPQAWDRTGRCFLEITGDVPDDLPKIIADSDETTFATSAWAGATSENGDEGEIVFYNPDDLSGMRGKWVFFDNMPRGTVSVPLINAGALGVVTTDFKQGTADPDATRWLNGPGSYGWYHVKGEPHIPMFCLTARRASALKKHLENGRKITLKGVIKTRVYDGEIYTVTGIIPGVEKEEFLLTGHLYEPFLNDNADGVAGAIEIGRMISSSGIVPQKTLRAVFSMEHYGLAQYYAQNLHTHKMFAGLNVDCLVGYTYRELGDELHFRLSPCTVPFAGDLILEHILQNFPYRFRWAASFGNLSDDTIGGDPEINIPTNWIYSKTNVFHHTNGRLFADVDWELSGELVKLLCSYVMFAVNSTAESVKSVLPELQKIALSFVKDDDTAWSRKVKCDFISKQLMSLNRIADGVFTEEEVSSIVDSLRLDGSTLAASNEVEERALSVVVARTQPGTPWSLAKVPAAEKRSFSYIPQPLHLALMDGKRSVLEAIRIYDVFNRNTMPQEKISAVITYLEYLEKYGYLTISKQS